MVIYSYNKTNKMH